MSLPIGSASSRLRPKGMWMVSVISVALLGAAWQVGCRARAADAATEEEPAAAEAIAPDAPELRTAEIWMGAYMGESKIGYQCISMFPDSVDAANKVDPVVLGEDASKTTVKVIPDWYTGEQVQVVRATGIQRMQMMGRTVEQTTELNEYRTPDGQMLAMVFRMSSAGMHQRMIATFDKDKIRYVQSTQQDEKTGEVDIPEGADFRDPEYGFKVENPEPGQTLVYHQFMPLLLRIVKFEATVVGPEEIEMDGKQVRAIRYEHKSDIISQTSWVDEHGDPLKTVAAIMDLRFVREAPEVAKTMEGPGGYVPSPDLVAKLQLTVDKPIEKPREVRLMRARIGRIARESLILSDERQTVTETTKEPDGTYSALYEVRTLDPPATALQLPIDDPAMAEYLKPTTHIQSTDQRLVDQARQIVGDEKDSLKAAQAIARWVSMTMRTRADIGLVRSALEVLESKEGVCRDYAALYAGLARAVGLPTRFVSGIVYWKSGFFYHAWDETYVGEWVTFDSTVAPGYPVDATHIKFSEGDVSDMVEMVPIIGALKLDIEEVQ